MEKQKQNVYMKKLEEGLTEFNTKLVKMKAKAAEAHDDIKVEYLTQVKNLENKRDELEVKYGKLKDSSEQAWDNVKAGTEKTWSELEDSFKKAISRFK